MRRALWMLILGLVVALPATAGPPGVFAIEGARIVVAPGEVIEEGTVVVRDGVIEAVGARVATPADAEPVDGEGLTVYPGLIEPYRTRPAVEAADAEGGEVRAETQDLIKPRRTMADAPADAADDRKLREAGFTTVLLAPEEGMFRGTAILANLGEGGVDANLIAPRVGQVVGLTTSSGATYPTSMMGAVALFRQTLADAAWTSEALRAWRKNPAQRRPARNPDLEALGGVAAGNHRVFFETMDNPLDTLLAARLIEEHGLDAVLVGHGLEYQRLEAIAESGLPHILPLDFPEAPDVGEAPDEGDDLGSSTVSLATLRHWDRAPDNPRLLLEAGVPVAFTSRGLSRPADLWDRIARATERGLSADDALAALTTTPARLLKIDDRAGRVAAGHMANLLLVEGDLVVAKPKIREVWVDGERFPIRETKEAEVDARGTWDIVILGGGQRIPVTLVITGEEGNLEGTIGAMGGNLPLGTAEVSGKELLVSFDSTPFGMPGEISFSLKIDGDTARGRGQSPQGPFTLTAERTAGPSPETALLEEAAR